MSLDASMAAGIVAPTIVITTAMQIVLPNAELLISDALPVVFPVNGVVKTFRPDHPTYGNIAAVGAIQSGVTSAAPAITVTMMVPTSQGVADICAPAAQGSPVKLWWCLIDPMTGATIGLPELLYNGQLDTALQTDNTNMRTLELNVTTMFERLFANSEGERLNNTWHQSLHPGETGLSLVIESSSSVFWGEDAVAPAYTPTIIAPTISDRLSGNGSGGLTNGSTPG